MDLKEVGIALYLVRKIHQVARREVVWVSDMFVVVESSCHPVAVSGHCTLSWVPCT